MISDETQETDILIIGGEGAGARAAIEASNYKAQITVLTKGRDIAKGGATVTAAASDIAVDSRSARELLGLPGDMRDSPATYMQDIVREGKFLNDQTLVESLVREGPRRVKELVEWGFRFDRFGIMPGHSYPRGCYGAPSTGPIMLRIFKDILKERSNVTIVGDMFIVDLLVKENRAVGAVAINLQTGKLAVWKAKATILATGGYQNLYPYVSSGKDLTGDGHAMAYRAGAELIGMEFPQFINAALLWPPEWRGAAGYIGLVHYLFPKGAYLLNRLGERYLTRWDPVRMENTTRDIGAISAMVEILDGRGSKHGGVYLSIKHLPDNFIDDLGEIVPIRNWVSAAGKDYRPLIEAMKKGLAIEIAPHCHFTMGGMRINTKCATNIAGLYAAGECAGGLHGANRIAGAALTQTLVQGAIAGETAAKYALKARQVNANEKELRKIKERVFEPLNRNEGIRPVQLRKKIQEVAFLNAGPVRDSSGLEKTIKEIETIKKQDMPRIHVDAKDPVYNLEWVEAFQAVNLLQVLELVTRSAYLRRESRGAHYRRDHTYVDNRNWLRNIVIRRGEDGRARTATRPVIVTRIRLPPRSTKPYPG